MFSLLIHRISLYEPRIYNQIKRQCRFCPLTKDELYTAVNIWCKYRQEALKKYGNISEWNVSNITDFNRLFKCNCSTVDNMFYCYCGKKYFNDNINDWDVSNSTNFKEMFWKCENFNQPLNKWKTNNATNMFCMFADCKKFNQDITNWNVKKVTDMRGMFLRCTIFDQNIGKWTLHPDVEVYLMFGYCGIFIKSLSNWVVKNDTHMFYHCYIGERNKPKVRMNI